jgi:hypothetical protein
MDKIKIESERSGEVILQISYDEEKRYLNPSRDMYIHNTVDIIPDMRYIRNAEMNELGDIASWRRKNKHEA